MKPDEEVYEILTRLGARCARVAPIFLPEPQRTERLEQRLKESVKNGQYRNSVEIARHLGRKLAPDELWGIRNVSVQRGYLEGAMAAAAAMGAGSSLTADEVDTIIQKFISRNLYHLVCATVSKFPQYFGDPCKRMEIIANLRNRGATESAFPIVNSLPEPERSDVLVEILKNSYRNNHSLACMVAELLLTPQEM